jgi:hypothetical protein
VRPPLLRNFFVNPPDEPWRFDGCLEQESSGAVLPGPVNVTGTLERMPEPSLGEILDFALALSLDARQFIMPLWKKVAVDHKPDGSEVTEADRGAEQLLRKPSQSATRITQSWAKSLAAKGSVTKRVARP